MQNNDILRRVRYIFDLDDAAMIDIFAEAELKVSRAQVCDWLAPEQDDQWAECTDHELAHFLNGFITRCRGRRDGPSPLPEAVLNNNIVFRKLKIALNLQADDVLDLLGRAGQRISKHELSALFRKPGHKHYRECQDQILRNFLKGLQLAHRPS